MVNYRNPGQLDTVFDALANGKRRDIVHALSYRPATVSHLAVEFGLSLPAIHKHIRILESARLLQRRKVGRVNFVALDRSGLRILQEWSGQYRTEWGHNDETLENYIASMIGHRT